MRRLLGLLFVTTLLLGCEKDKEESRDAFVESIEVEQGVLDVYKASVYNESFEAVIFSNTLLSELNFPIELNIDIKVSDGATLVPSSKQFTFSNADQIIKLEVTSENGNSSKEYTLKLRDRQIPVGDFEMWYEAIGMNSQTFLEPGASEEATVWATANMGSSIYGIYTTLAVEESGNTMAKMTTISTEALPIISGSTFIGKFDLQGAIANPTDPSAAASLGMPFVFKPSGIKFKYKYNPGSQMIQASLKEEGNLFGGFDVEEVSGTDKYGIAVFLEKRDGENIEIIAQAKIEGDVDMTDFEIKSLVLEYLSSEEPTHFHVSFSSSFNGGSFLGAEGSTLLVDDVELIYEE